jgi:hypothetical protein
VPGDHVVVEVNGGQADQAAMSLLDHEGLFSHPFPNTGSRSRSIARKVPGRTSPMC